ncbi:MAG: DUF4145 domain-containing protein [Candidatus Heimdallarchaeaceae archaeon]|jgi:uncharacterized protein YutE (UPF0331/DUF86 family)
MNQNTHTDLKKFIVDLIDEYRNEFASEEKILDGRYKFPLELSEPCQISLLWMRREEQYDYQIILKTKNPNKNDKQVTIFGPYSIDNDNDVRKMERLLEVEFFRTVEYQNKIERYKKVFENSIKKGHQKIRKTQISVNFGGSILEGSDYLIFVPGRINLLEISKILDEIKREISREFPRIQPFTLYDFFGGFIEPPVWIGEIPSVDYTSRLKGTVLREHLGDDIDFVLKGKKGILHRDGFISLSMKEWKERDKTSNGYPFSASGRKDIIKSIADLNEILGFLLLLGYPIKSANNDSFSWKTYVSEKESISVSYKPNSYGEKMKNERNKDLDIDSFKGERILIDENHFRISVSTINKYYELDKSTDYKRLPLIKEFSLAYSALNNLLYKQSYEMLWSIIEQILKQTAKKRGFRSKGKISMIINQLHSNNVIDDSLYKKLDRMRDKRNELIHELGKVNSSETTELLNLCRTLLVTHLNYISMEHSDTSYLV